MSSTVPPTPTDVNLGWSLAVLLHDWHKRVESVLTDLPHGSRGYHVLSACAGEGPPTQAALAERLLIDRSVMTYLIDDLETAGLVQRKVDPHDRRVRRVCTTEQGRTVLARACTRVEHEEAQTLAGLEETDRSLFREAAIRAATAVRQAFPDIDPCAAAEQVVDHP